MKDSQALCFRDVMGFPCLKFSFTVPEQAILVGLEPLSTSQHWPRAGTGQGGCAGCGAGPFSRFPKGGRLPVGASCGVDGRSAQRGLWLGTGARLRPDGWTGHTRVLRQPCWDCWPQGPCPRPLCHAHEGAEAEKGSPSNTESPMKSTFLSQSAGLAQACCFRVASH